MKISEIFSLGGCGGRGYAPLGYSIASGLGAHGSP